MDTSKVGSGSLNLDGKGTTGRVTLDVPLTTVGDLHKLINDIEAGKHDELLSDMTNDDHMETIDAIGTICKSIQADNNNADVISCKVSHVDDSINLIVDESTKPSDPIVQSVDINTKSTLYAGAAGASAKDQPKVNSNFRTLVADPVFDGVNISIPRKVVKKVSTRFEHTLYGYFIGKRMAFSVVEYYARNNWAKHGLKRIMMNSKGFFFFKFDSRAGLEAVLEGGPWLIQADLVDVVTIGIPSLFRDGFTKETIRVEYEWRAPRCDICKIFGHVHDHCPKKAVSPPIVTASNVVTPTVEKTNDDFQTVGIKKKRKGKFKSTNGGQFVGPSVKQNVRYEPKVTTSAPKKGVTNVGNISQSTSMLKTTGYSSKKDNLSMSNSFSALNDDEEDDEEEVQNVYDESVNLLQNTKAYGSSSFTATAAYTDRQFRWVICGTRNIGECSRAKSKSAKKQRKRKVWKPTGKMFTTIGYMRDLLVGPSNIVEIAVSVSPNSSSGILGLRLCFQDLIRRSLSAPISSTNFLGTVKFGYDHVAKILGYGDYQIGNVTISRVYYVEGLGHNFFSVRQFCDSNLEVAFRQHTCFIRNLEGVDLLTVSRGNNLYTLSLGYITINHLARHGLVRGIPKLKFEKDHLCSARTMGKSKKKPHKPKSEDTNQEKFYLLHMDLCRPMRVASVNGKKYILVISMFYSSIFTWVKFLRSKDEAPDFIIKFLKMIQLRLKVPVRRIRTDNGTEFVNQTLREYYEKVGISHKTSVARSPQQNAVATACYTQNRSIIRLRHGKTPYELLHDKLPDLSFFHVFGALCYPTNDSENLGKLQPKADIGNDPYFGIPIPEVLSDQSSSSDSTMQEELNEFERLEVWEVVPQPDKVMVITLKWIYKVKLDLLGAPRAWYDMLSSFLISQDLSKGSVDPTLFIRRDGITFLTLVTSGYSHGGYIRTGEVKKRKLVDPSTIVGNSAAISSMDADILLCWLLCSNPLDEDHSLPTWLCVSTNIPSGMKSFTPETLKQLADEVDE
ncbi:retrovirus-related pol polyprotein from transposon TNT 1-94 [Tanacetum coccineum]